MVQAVLAQKEAYLNIKVLTTPPLLVFRHGRWVFFKGILNSMLNNVIKSPREETILPQHPLMTHHPLLFVAPRLFIFTIVFWPPHLNFARSPRQRKNKRQLQLLHVQLQLGSVQLTKVVIFGVILFVVLRNQRQAPVQVVGTFICALLFDHEERNWLRIQEATSCANEETKPRCDIQKHFQYGRRQSLEVSNLENYCTNCNSLLDDFDKNAIRSYLVACHSSEPNPRQKQPQAPPPKPAASRPKDQVDKHIIICTISKE